MKQFTSAKEFKNVLSIDRLSNCCGAVVYPDLDICSDCKEHRGIEETCDLCEGKGTIEVRADYHPPMCIDERWIKTTCTKCAGEGTIECDE